jgi:hypothetical protein
MTAARQQKFLSSSRRDASFFLPRRCFTTTIYSQNVRHHLMRAPEFVCSLAGLLLNLRMD